ncbi:hypothetical protein Hbl1158_12240 [Halobaculum sp. CBA1158]|uniref:DUF7523 family protein n=1 Tax=Halobaculum sp. CBA1158 TaxID=2904243 RepID=UPI001F3DD56A|nr:hypothetical protein [Halobaculum sp. CBA1158]UIO99293.1 hypothetical protein Hbl1158_12240 [Halobaculum sp. CBA1158]
MTVAEETREAVRERPFLLDALRAGVVNYAAAASLLDLDADADAVATALRRFGDDLRDERAARGDAVTADGDPTADGGARVTMHRGVGRVAVADDASDGGTLDGETLDADATDHSGPVLRVGGVAYALDAGDATAVLARGSVDAGVLERVLGRLRTAGVAVEAAGATPEGLAVVVGRRDGASALRVVEAVVG